MNQRELTQVQRLCEEIVSLCKTCSHLMPAEDSHFLGPDSHVAMLKRRSLDLTRALSILRGRGKIHLPRTKEK